MALITRIQHPEATVAAAKHLKFWIGATNTVVLICSSLTMSMAIEFSRMGWQRAMVRAMLATAALGSLFLVLKGYEYYADWDEHMMPFLSERPFALAETPAARLFVNLYYVATLLHALHLFTGIALLLGMTWMAAKAGLPVAAPELDRGLRPVLALHRPGLDPGLPDPLRGEPVGCGTPSRP